MMKKLNEYVVTAMMIAICSCSLFTTNGQPQTTQPCKPDLSQYQELETVDVNVIHPKYIEFVRKQIQSATYEIDIRGITTQPHPWGVALTVKTIVGDFTFYGLEDNNGVIKAKYVTTTQAAH